MRIVTAALLIGAASVASAGTDPIAVCRTAHAGDSAAHIACLEDALRASGAAPSAVARTAPAAEVPAAVSAAPAAAATPTPSGLGAEQAKARQRSPDAPTEQAATRIVAVRYTASGLGLFTMADGQVWLETVATPERHHLEPGREYAARIERGKVGGYRMYVEGVKWMHKVERLK